jgi:hypothetical protein
MQQGLEQQGPEQWRQELEQWQQGPELQAHEVEEDLQQLFYLFCFFFFCFFFFFFFFF